VLKHVGAEEVTVRQRIDRRDQSQKKYHYRSNEIERPPSLSEGEKVANERKCAKK
jgi:hypothetical protein